MTATLVDARINGSPVVGQLVMPSYIGSHLGTIPFMHEFEWLNAPYANLSAPTPFRFRVKFPPKPWYQHYDVVSYCIRFRYTNINCVTCDTVICFKRIRYGWIIVNNPGLSQAKGSRTARQQ